MLKIVSLIKHSVYSGYTYRAVSVKVLGDHKVHSAVLLSLPGIDLTTVLVQFLSSQQLLLMDWILLCQWFLLMLAALVDHRRFVQM